MVAHTREGSATASISRRHEASGHFSTCIPLLAIGLATTGTTSCLYPFHRRSRFRLNPVRPLRRSCVAHASPQPAMSSRWAVSLYERTAQRSGMTTISLIEPLAAPAKDNELAPVASAIIRPITPP